MYIYIYMYIHSTHTNLFERMYALHIAQHDRGNYFGLYSFDFTCLKGLGGLYLMVHGASGAQLMDDPGFLRTTWRLMGTSTVGSK